MKDLVKKVVYQKIEDRKPRYTNAGSPTKKTFKRVNDPDGSWHLEETGEVNLQEMIQSAAPPSMSVILRHASRGDFSLLNANGEGIYEDVSKIHDLGDVYLTNQKAQVEVAKVAKNKKAAASMSVKESEKVNNSEGENSNA